MTNFGDWQRQWPRDDHYSRARENNFMTFEQVHRYVIEIGGLAITLMDDVAKKYGLKFKPVVREGHSPDTIAWPTPCDCPETEMCPCACHEDSVAFQKVGINK